MGDVFDKDKRSDVMARIRGTGNKATELALIRLFHDQGITGWRRRQAVFGRPDFVFRKRRIAVFVDGCFWHGCPKHARIPGTNRQFWVRKLEANRLRDKLVNRTLRAAGWRVVRIWEHDLTRKNQGKALRRIYLALGVSPATPVPPALRSSGS